MAGKKLLVADDSLTIQKVIRLALSNEGYEIQAVSDGNDAVQQISLFRPDVILIDVSLPGRSAFEVKREVNDHEDLKDVRFVLMSSAFEKVDEEQAAEVVFHGRLTKPFDPGHLREVLNGVLDQVPVRQPQSDSTISLDRPPSIAGPKPSPATPPKPPQQQQQGPASALPPELPAKPKWKTGPIYEKYPNTTGVVKSPAPPEPTVEIISEARQAPPSPPPPPPAGRQDDDIRQLTESTIRMSGLDDFEWSVQEPSLKPPPSLLEVQESDFSIDSSRGSDQLFTPPAPSMDPPHHQQQEEPPPPQQHSRQAATIPVHVPPAESMISLEQVEEIVRRQVEETLEKMAQRILPEVAEKVIKAEIHRMLNEQF